MQTKTGNTKFIEILEKLEENQKKELLGLAQKLLVGEEIFEENIIETPYYNPKKSSFFSEDIENILKQFPENRKWLFADLQNEYIFPKEHFVKIELIDYKIYVMPDPSYLHQKIVTNVATFMNLYVLKNGLGDVVVSPVSIKIDEGNVKKPDLLFISVKKIKENPDMLQKQFVQGIPDLVVEVISPANYKKLREEKKELYEKVGVEEYWEIYPAKHKVIIETLEVIKNESGEIIKSYQNFSEAEKTGKVHSKVLEGFSLDLENIFTEALETD